MTPPTPSRSRVVGGGLVALGKALLLLAGVPAAAARLAVADASGTLPTRAADAVGALLAAAAIAWAIAAFSFVRELIGAVRTGGTVRSLAWPGRWALAIVGLLLAAGIVGAPIHDGGAGRPAAAADASATALLDGAAIVAALGTVVAAALWGRAERLTRLRAMQRAPGTVPVEPATSVRSLATALAGTDARALAWTESANRVLGACAQRGPLPDILAVRASPDGLELVLGGAHPAPHPFVAVGDATWRFDPALTLGDIVAGWSGAPRWCPQLVPVGFDRAELIVPCPAGRLLGVIGDDADVDAAMRRVAFALRVAPWSDELAIELVGLAAPPLEEQSVHLQPSSLSTLRDLAAEPRDRGDIAWQREPLGVVARLDADDAHDELRAIARRVGVVAGGMPGDLTLEVARDRARLLPLRTVLSLHSFDAPARRSVDTLLQDFAAPFRSGASARIARTGGAVVRILGPDAELTGTVDEPNEVDRERVTEVVAYLCLAGGDVARTDIASELLGGTDTIAMRRLDHVLATARTSLGPAPDGRDRIRATSERVVLVDCTVDADELHDEAERARGEDPVTATATLRAALAPIGPGLLDAARTWPWFRARRHDERIRAHIVDACHHLATLALAAGDGAVAADALARGRAAAPGSEILARDQMVFCDAIGLPAGVEETFQELAETLDALGAAEPSKATHDLYRILTERPEV